MSIIWIKTGLLNRNYILQKFVEHVCSWKLSCKVYVNCSQSRKQIKQWMVLVFVMLYGTKTLRFSIMQHNARPNSFIFCSLFGNLWHSNSLYTERVFVWMQNRDCGGETAGWVVVYLYVRLFTTPWARQSAVLTVPRREETNRERTGGYGHRRVQILSVGRSTSSWKSRLHGPGMKSIASLSAVYVNLYLLLSS